MAKIKFGALVADARNAIGGIVYSRNTWGAYVREKVSPVQPRTPYQQAQRASLSELAKRYSTVLTDEQRAGWINLAAANPLIDVFGNAVALTGITMYEKVNRVRHVLGLPTLDDPPANLNVVNPDSCAVSIVNEPAFKIEVAFVPSPAPADHYVEVWATPPLTPGVMFYTNKLRLIYVSTPAPASPLDITDAYVARFGTIPPTRKVGIAVRFAKGENGAQSREVRGTATRPLG